MAGMYGVYHGADGLIYIGNTIQSLTTTLNKGVEKLGLIQTNNSFFDTLAINVSDSNIVKKIAEEKGINFYYQSPTKITISLSNQTESAKKMMRLAYCYVSIIT